MSLTTFDRSSLPAPRTLEEAGARAAAGARALSSGLLHVVVVTMQVLGATVVAVGRWFLAEPRRIRTALAGLVLSAVVGAAVGAAAGYLLAAATEQALAALHLDRG